MRLQTERTRLFISTWYTGSGSKKSVFTRRANRPFEKIRQIYGDELERLKSSHPHKALTFHTITAKQRQAIRRRAIVEIRRENIKRLALLLLTTIVTIALIIGLNYFIKMKLNR